MRTKRYGTSTVARRAALCAISALVCVLAAPLAQAQAATPTVTKVEPSSGPAVGGTTVTITGTGFSGATAVKFGSSNAHSFTVNSETSITAVNNSGAGAVDVTVTTPGGTSPISSADRFTYAPALTVTKLEPSSGPAAGGTPVTITGTGFNAPGDGVTAVLFGSSNATSFTVNSETSITAVSPPGANTVDVRIRGVPVPPAGFEESVTSPADVFSYLGNTIFNPTGAEQTFTVPAGVTSVNVLAIGEAGGEEPFKEMRIHGGRPAEVRGELSVTPGQTLYVEVGVHTFNGGACNLFEARCNFASGGGASDVRTSPRAAGLSPDTRLIVAGGGGGEGNNTTGAGNTGEGGVGGNAGEPGKSPATIAGFPTPEGGGAGTLSHGGAGGLGAFFNGMAGTLGSGGIGGIGHTPPQFAVQEPEGGGGGGGYYGGGGGGGGNEVTAPPAGAGGGGGSSLVPAGGSTTVSAKVCGQLNTQKPCGLVQITYKIVTKVEPTSGPAAGGTPVTITGNGFSGVTAVKFGSTNATSFKVNSETSITAVSPPGAGTVDVTVTGGTPGGTTAPSEADRFTYGPTVTNVEPNHGSPGGGTTVTITGTSFTGATAVKFGSTNAQSFTVNSATSITAVSPKGKSTVDVTVTTPAGTSPTSAADQFTFSRK